MAVVDVVNQRAEKVSQVELPDAIYNVPVKPGLLHEVVRMQLASRRAGTAAVKHRSDVSGSRRKLFKQKGTGRARRGDINSPLLRGGGSVFGPDPRSFAFSMPKKARRLALKMALSSKLQEQALIVLNALELERIKTHDVVGVLDALGTPRALLITPAADHTLELSARNLPGVKVLRVEGLNVYDILRYERLVVLEPALKGIEGRLLA
jgi:large subunit ribosomal protein L4